MQLPWIEHEPPPWKGGILTLRIVSYGQSESNLERRTLDHRSHVLWKQASFLTKYQVCHSPEVGQHELAPTSLKNSTNTRKPSQFLVQTLELWTKQYFDVTVKLIYYINISSCGLSFSCSISPPSRIGNLLLRTTNYVVIIPNEDSRQIQYSDALIIIEIRYRTSDKSWLSSVDIIFYWVVSVYSYFYPPSTSK